MDMLKKDTIPGDIATLVAAVSLIGGFMVINEILDEYPHFFCQNKVKKVILWCIVYLQVKSISKASFISIIIVLLFPRIFFGKITGRKIVSK
jgi:hypothetical protein